ncbi:MAG: bifunctional pyr operon transcriptional regulator/uracil phosphoribosyltransferase PyrR [Cytophagales bacterium]|nr:bifunctional pyr operon transcriptional regulator/uracil phosphoribosyltransferase PyrR [Cytophagales bacterium]
MNAEKLYADLRDGLEPWRSPSTHWVGIASGGAWMVERLQHDWGLDNIGIISSSMHRDDYLRRRNKSNSHPIETTDLPFDVTGAHIVLLDDVLYTGRTIRAVLNELFDYGRPASVRLAVLVDRGGRELPIHADFAADKQTVPQGQSLALSKALDGTFTFEMK